MEKLKIGVAYHGNRLYSRAESDMKDIIEHNFNTVVHMFSHNDWDRSKNVMKDIFAMTTGLGLDLWVDNWGLSGAPGDTSHFLCYHPEAHQYTSDGVMRPKNVCYNQQSFVDWSKEWIDTVYDIGGRKIFWDEPYLSTYEDKFSCACPVCKKLFSERYNREMPVIPDDNCYEFQEWTIINYLDIVSRYARIKGMENIVCIMPTANHGISFDSVDALKKLEAMDNIGCDPYWISRKTDVTGTEVYKKVYNTSKRSIDICNNLGKKNNIWIQTYNNPSGREEDILYAAEAAFDAGARNILMWGYRGSEGNDYHSINPDLTWQATGEAAARILQKERDRIVAQARKELGL